MGNRRGGAQGGAQAQAQTQALKCLYSGKLCANSVHIHVIIFVTILVF